ncbi:MAG: M14 family zinc carboxypeptidase [Nakamurella sp.]
MGRVAALGIVGVMLAGLVGVVPTAWSSSASSPPRLVAAAAADSSAALATVVDSRVFGVSVQGRPITAYQVGDPSAVYRAVVLGSMHGFSEQAGQSVTLAIRSMPIPAGLDLWVIDTINPDGNALQQRGNAHGVDLNRNWPNRWQSIAPSTFDTHYSGPAPLSEPETVAMYHFLRQVHPNRLVSMHQPLDGVDSTDGGRRDPQFRDALSVNLGIPVAALTCFGGCHGSMTGYLTNYSSTAAITVEFGDRPTQGYLTGQAARGILAALMVGRSAPARQAGSANGDVAPTGAYRSTAASDWRTAQRRALPAGGHSARLGRAGGADFAV